MEVRMRRTLIAGLVVLTLALGGVAIAQQPPEASTQPETTTITGCLKAGTNTGQFVLVLGDGKQYQVQAAEGVEGLDLAAHENHRVELTGTLDKDATDPVLKATALKMVATSCESQ
jgi:hypothetical protein